MTKKPRLLIIDNDTETLKHLKNFGYEIKHLTKSSDALDFLKETTQTFDLIVLEIILPFISGWEILKFIRNNPDLAHLPVLIITSLTEKTNELLALRSGADDFIRKSADMDLILARIDALLRRTLWNNQTYVNLKKLGFISLPKEDINITHREKTILNMISEGKNNEEMAKELCLSMLTVKTHKKNIFKKLNISNKTEALIVALTLGLID